MKCYGKVIMLVWIIGMLFSLPAKGQDAWLTSISIEPYTQTGKNHPLEVTLTNEESEPLGPFKIGWTIQGSGNIHTSPMINPDEQIVKFDLTTIKVPDSFAIESSGDFKLKAWVQDVNGDTNTRNDAFVMNSTAIGKGYRRTTLLEMLTGTWCSLCPKANKAANEIADSTDQVAVAKFHYSDELANPEGTDYFLRYTPDGRAPTSTGILNMGRFGRNTLLARLEDQKDDIIDQAANSISPADVTVNAFIDKETRMLTLDLETTFRYQDSGNYYINAYVLESNIDTPQANASDDYRHHHVVRKMLAGAEGDGDLIPAQPELNQSYEKQYRFRLPQEWNMQEVSVLGVAYQKRSDGKTLAMNADKQKNLLSNNLTSRASPAVPTDMTVYPNPFSEHLSIDLSEKAQDLAIALYGIQGRKVLEKTIRTQSGHRQIRLDLSKQNLPSGIYTLKVTSAGSSYTERLR